MTPSYGGLHPRSVALAINDVNRWVLHCTAGSEVAPTNRVKRGLVLTPTGRPLALSGISTAIDDRARR